MHKLWGITILLGFITMSGCSSQQDPQVRDPLYAIASTTPMPTPFHPATQEPVFTPNLSPTPPTTPTSHPEITVTSYQSFSHYSIYASYDYPNQSISIEQTIQHPALLTAVDEWVLIAEPARLGDNFVLESLVINGEMVTQVEIGDGVLRAIPSSMLDSQKSVTIQLHYYYSLKPRASKLGYTQNAANFGDWYVFIPPYQEGIGKWLAYPRANVGEHLLYPISDFDVTLEINGAPPELMIAASARTSMSENIYSFQQNQSRNFTWVASTRFQVSEAMLGDISVASYYFHRHRAAGLVALETTVSALELFQNLFGPYNQSHLAIVEAEFPDGMEYHGLYFLGGEYYETFDGTARTYLVTLATHETAHQWFYGLVGNDSAQEPWLDEALCTFSELLYYEHFHPDLVDWWWNYRVLRFNPTGWVNGAIYDYPDFRRYVDAVYLRGALWLADVRSIMGDDIFMDSLNSYINAHALSFADQSGFFAHIQIDKRQELDGLTSVYFQAR
jgi:hypothetical protein